MKKGKIPPYWRDLIQHRSQISAPKNIDFQDTRFTQYLEEDPTKTPSHEPSAVINSDN